MKCDPNTGFCQFDFGAETKPAPISNAVFENEMNKDGKIDVFYFTDALCSYCWQAEPEINKFILEYSEHINFYTVMGSMLTHWQTSEAADMKNEINMQKLWSEVASTYRMPSDGSAWIRETPSSSYPSARVYDVLIRKSPHIAELFLRRAKELTFVQNRNAGSYDNLEIVIQDCIDSLGETQYNAAQIIEEAKSVQADTYLDIDASLMRKFKVEVFPSLIMVNPKGESLLLKGKNDYESYDYAIKELSDANIEPKPIPELNEVLGIGNYLFAKEIEVLYSLKPQEVQKFIKKNLSAEGYVEAEILDETVIIKQGAPDLQF